MNSNTLSYLMSKYEVKTALGNQVQKFEDFRMLLFPR